ncbi:Global transcription regulator sge1 [Mucor circinelloides]
MSVSETFHGYIETTQDSLLVFEACRRNILPKVSRRLQERERRMVRSGSVFVFDEKDSGIKRWTDGLVWSPSRILGNFLIYRELDKKPSASQKQQIRKRSTSGNTLSDTTGTASKIRQAVDGNPRTNRQLVGSLSEAYNFKEHGLIKKTMSLVVNGAPLHLVSYYHPNDVLEHQLRTPSVVPELANLEISPELLSKQNFRIPPMIEPDTTPPSNVPTPTQSTPNTPVPNYPSTASVSTPLKNTSIHALLSNSYYPSRQLAEYHYSINMPATPTSTTSNSDPQEDLLGQRSYFIQ